MPHTILLHLYLVFSSVEPQSGLQQHTPLLCFILTTTVWGKLGWMYVTGRRSPSEVHELSTVQCTGNLSRSNPYWSGCQCSLHFCTTSFSPHGDLLRKGWSLQSRVNRNYWFGYNGERGGKLTGEGLHYTFSLIVICKPPSAARKGGL